MAFNLDDYVDVAERIRIFHERYPEGSLQSHVDFIEGGVLCVAEAYRTADDIRPGVGHAFEPIPGKTPYTKDSEVMNAETSAWGRAIVALGFETKKIASREEVRNRTGPAEGSGIGSGGTPGVKRHPVRGTVGGASITTEQLNQAIAFAKEHGTDWATEVGVHLGDVKPSEVTEEQARQVFTAILDNAAKQKATA